MRDAAAHRSTDTLWRMAQTAAMLATLTLLWGLVAQPDLSLKLLWSLAIPLVPASLLISAQIWRNVCPLATLNMALNRPGTPTLRNGGLVVSTTVGIVLLVILVPARHVLFNTNGIALAVTIAAVALVALVGGRYFDAKAGFCNAICPVLPVERLYGQSPLVEIGNPRCVPCTHCTAKGCLDLNAQKSALVSTGIPTSSLSWLRSPYGAFAAAFPGFVIAYYLTTDGPFATTGDLYLRVALWSAASYGLVLLTVGVFGIAARNALLGLAALAVGLYYWFAAPGLAEAWSLGEPFVGTVRVVALGLVAVWLIVAHRRVARDRSVRPVPQTTGTTPPAPQ